MSFPNLAVGAPPTCWLCGRPLGKQESVRFQADPASVEASRERLERPKFSCSAPYERAPAFRSSQVATARLTWGRFANFRFRGKSDRSCQSGSSAGLIWSERRAEDARCPYRPSRSRRIASSRKCWGSRTYCAACDCMIVRMTASRLG